MAVYPGDKNNLPYDVVVERLHIEAVSYTHLDVYKRQTLQEAAYQQMQAEVSQMAASSQLPEAQEQALDCLLYTSRCV